MTLFEHVDFDDHEHVSYLADPKSGLKAIIAVHNTHRGPALGGCRMFPYADEAAALKDVLRLSRGMTYKSAMAGLPLGGGKSVIIGDPNTQKSPALLKAFATGLERLGGYYIAAEDSGTSVADMQTIRATTPHVAGFADRKDEQGQALNGDPSPATAYGTFVGVKAAVEKRFNTHDLTGLRVAVQGVGNVGFRLAQYLTEAGADVWVADIDAARCQHAVATLGANAVALDEIHRLAVDVFAPCALGGAINDQTLSQLQAKVVAGAANNQLAEPRHGDMLRERGILYAPDYVINAGGIIDIAFERQGHDRTAMLAHVEGIGRTLMDIFEQSEQREMSTQVVADMIARQCFSAE